jgi:plasmid stability protein
MIAGGIMAQLLVRNLESNVKSKLQRRAKRHGRSMEEEVREILRDATKDEGARRVKLGTEIAALFRGIGLKPGEEIRELRDIKLEIPDFKE